MSTQAEKDVLKEIVDRMDISDEELEFKDAADIKPTTGECSKVEKSAEQVKSLEVNKQKSVHKGQSVATSQTKSESTKKESIEEESEKNTDTSSKKTTTESIGKSTKKPKDSKKVTDDIVDAIFESKNVEPEKITARSTRSKKRDSEGDKNNEEETIENIQTLLDTKVVPQKPPKKALAKDGLQSKITEEVDKSGVFISINSKDDSGKFLAEEDCTYQSANHLEASQEIPQVMLDQLDLKKFPNLKINDKTDFNQTSSPVAKKVIEKENQNNSKLLAEIQKRMDLRKARQRKSQEDHGSEDEPVAPTKEKVATTKEKVATTKEKVATVKEQVATVKEQVATVEEQVATVKEEVITVEEQVVPENEQVVETPRRGRGRPKKGTHSPDARPTPTQPKAVPGPASSKKEMAKPKNEKKAATEEEEEGEDEEVPILARSRSSRKIKMTDKFKSFVTQEKTIKSLLLQEESPVVKKSANVKSKTLITPKAKPKYDVAVLKKPNPDGQINLKRKHQEMSGEEEVELDEGSMEEEDDDEKARKTPKRKAAKKAAKATKKIDSESAPKSRRKELISESELSDGYDVVDDEDMDPDFDDYDGVSDASVISYEAEESFETRSTTNTRTVLDLMKDVFQLMPTWNVHILPNTNTFCIAQIVRGVNGIPMLKKSIEVDHDFNARVYVHQIHYKKYDGVYDSEDHFIELLQLVDSM